MSHTVTATVLRGLGVTKVQGREQALMTSDKDMIYVAGRNVMWHNVVRDRVRVLPQTPRVQSILAVAVCPKRRYVAICEQQDHSHGQHNVLPQVSIIDLISGAGPKRLRTLIATEDTHLSFGGVSNPDGSEPLPPNFTCAEFSKDSKSLLCLVGAPYNGLVVFDWFRSRKVGTCTINASVTRCRFNPTDSSQVSTSGPQHLRVWKVQEGLLKGFPTIQGVGSTGASVTDHAWTNDDRLAVTTDHGEVLIYDEGDLVQTIGAAALGMKKNTNDGLHCIASLDDRGFICGGPRGSLCIVEMTDTKDRLEGRDPFKVPCKVQALKEATTPQSIVSLGCSPKCDVVVLAFPDNVGLLNMSDVWLKAEQGSSSGSNSGSSATNEENKKEQNGAEERKETTALTTTPRVKVVECNISFLVKGFHTGAITGMSTCARKPLLITCSKEDKSIRLWNYRTHVCMDALVFENDAQRPMCVDIHPSGHLVLVGFSGRVHLYHVRMDGLRYSREILIKGSRMAKFSGHGGLIAVGCSRRLEIYRTYTEECIGGFTGHSMPITAFTWSKDDMSIVSCAMDGSVYEWDLNGLDGHAPCGTRAGEHHCGLPSSSGFSYNTVVCGSNGSVCVSGAVQGTLKAKNSGGSSGGEVGKTPVGFGSGAPKGSSNNGGSGGATTKGSGASSNNNMIRAWDTKHLEGKGCVIPTSINITAVELQSHHLVAGGSDGTISFYNWPLEMSEKLCLANPHQVAISTIAVSPDHKVIFTGGSDGTIVMSKIQKSKVDNTAVFHGDTVASSSRSSRMESAATSARPFLDEILCLTDTQEQEAIQGKIMDLDATIVDLKGTFRFEKREFEKEKAKMILNADQTLANEKRMGHEMEIELKRLLRASESEGRAKSDAKEAKHMETAKLLEDLYDRKLVMKQEDLRETQNKLRDLIVGHEDMKLKHNKDVERIKTIAQDREVAFHKKFTKEKKQMEQYIAFIKERYEDTADVGEDLHDVELVRLKQEFEQEKVAMDMKMQTTQGEIVLLKKSASMMKESLDEETRKANASRVEKLTSDRRLKDTVSKMNQILLDLERSKKESTLKDEQIKSHLRRVGDLERVRRVLQHQLHEARGQLEPMDTEMTTMKETIEELNKEYTSGMKAAAVLERKTKTSNHKQTILQKELIKGSNKITKLKSTILKFSRDVESIVTQPGSNHAKWAEGLLDLYKTYVTDLPISGKIKGPNDATIQEFDRQRMFMEKTVKALKKQSSNSEKMVAATKKRVVSENTVLVTELNALRRTVKSLRNTIDQLESDKLRYQGSNSSSSSTNGGSQYKIKGGGGSLGGGRSSRNSVLNGQHSLASSTISTNSMNSMHSMNSMNSSQNINNNRHEEEAKYESKYDKELQQKNSNSTSSKDGDDGDDGDEHVRRRNSALGQVARTTFGNGNRPRSSAPRLGNRTTSRRPASAIAGMSSSSGRPKSGGRPLTASERRRKIPVGPSLSRSMSRLRASKSEKTLSFVQSKLDQAYMNDKAKTAEINRLTVQLSAKEKRNRHLEDYVANHGGVGGRKRDGRNGTNNKTSPGSASILSDYSRASSGGGEQVFKESVDSPPPPSPAANNVTGRQVLSPLNKRKALQKSLRVG